MMKKILFLLIVQFVFVFGQKNNADEILNKVKENFDRVNDYVVNVSIKVDVSFLKIPKTNATIYFKKPDKIKLSSKDFALLPKQGLDFSPMGILKGKYTAIFNKDTSIDGNDVAVIKVIPLNDSGDIVLTTLWIDKKNEVILKAELSTKVNGTFLLSFSYKNSPDDFPLPSSMVFSFNTERFSMPQVPDENQSNSSQNKKESKPKEGKVYINYYNYKVNEGLPDSIFVDTKQNK